MPDPNGLTPLFAAVRTHDLDTIVNLVINAGVNLEQVNAEDKTPLMVACKLRIAELLVKLGADVLPAWDSMPDKIKAWLICSMPPDSMLANRMLEYAIASVKALPVDRLLEDHILTVLLGKEGHALTVGWDMVIRLGLYPIACRSAEAGDNRLLLAILESYGNTLLICEGGYSCLLVGHRCREGRPGKGQADHRQRRRKKQTDRGSACQAPSAFRGDIGSAE